MAFGRISDLWKPKEFPEKGMFQGVAYRIDGDAVLLKCSSGYEIHLSPSAELSPEEFDEVRHNVVKRRFITTGLSSWGAPPDPNLKTASLGNNAPEY